MLTASDESTPRHDPPPAMTPLSAHPNPRHDAPSMLPPDSLLAPPASVSYRVLVSVQGGLHDGSAHVAQPGHAIVVGSDGPCQLVLMDDGVAPQALRLLEMEGQLVLEVLDHGVSLLTATPERAAGALALGPHRLGLPQVLLHVGRATLQVELLRRTRRLPSDRPPGDLAGAGAPWAQPPQARRRTGGRAAPGRPWLSFTLAGLSLAALLAVAGGAVNATAPAAPGSAAAGPAALPAGAVIAAFNARGAQLVQVHEDGLAPAVRGLVSDGAMRLELEQALRSARPLLALQVHDLKQMAESLTRLARLGGYTCGVRHLGEARFACEVPVPDEAAAARLQALVASVPGVQSLAVTVRAGEAPRRWLDATLAEASPGAAAQPPTHSHGAIAR